MAAIRKIIAVIINIFVHHHHQRQQNSEVMLKQCWFKTMFLEQNTRTWRRMLRWWLSAIYVKAFNFTIMVQTFFMLVTKWWNLCWCINSNSYIFNNKMKWTRYLRFRNRLLMKSIPNFKFPVGITLLWWDQVSRKYDDNTLLRFCGNE